MPERPMTRFAVHPDLPPGLAHDFRENHQRLFDEATLISKSREQVTKSFSHQGRPFIIKRYPEHGARHRVQVLLGRTRAMNSFRRARALAEIGVKTPPHLLVAGHLGLCKAGSFLIMAKSPGEQLYAMIHDHPQRVMSGTILKNVAALALQMHQAGLTHGDLHARNLLVLNDESVEVIDLDGMDRRKRRQPKDRARLLNSFRARPEVQQHLAGLLAEGSR